LQDFLFKAIQSRNLFGGFIRIIQLDIGKIIEVRLRDESLMLNILCVKLC